MKITHNQCFKKDRIFIFTIKIAFSPTFMNQKTPKKQKMTLTQPQFIACARK